MERGWILIQEKPIPTEKDRNECSTSETVHCFFETTLTRDLCEGIPPELFLNADETSVEVGLPRKIIIPPGEKQRMKVDKTAYFTFMMIIF